MRRAVLSLLLTALIVAAQTERRSPGDAWPVANHFRTRVPGNIPTGTPIAADIAPPAAFNPDSVRVTAQDSTQLIPAKVDFRNPEARISFRSTGAPAYWIYFDETNLGETQRLTAPAMVGTGDRITFGKPGLRGRVAVGLQPRPAALDFDGDGDTDLVISCPDRPYNGTYLFLNLGSNQAPLYDRALRLGPGLRELTAADFNGDGEVDLVTTGGYFSDFRHHRLSRFVEVKLNRTYHVGRDDMWQPFDWDGDGRIDLLTGVSDWRDYGWDDAFDDQGRWTRGPLHGFVYLHRNTGTNAEPKYAPPVKLETTNGQPIDVYGSPAPNIADWFGRGAADLILGSFVDTVTIFRNTGTRQRPQLEAGVLAHAAGRPLRMDLCMIQPRVVRWHSDQRSSLLIAEEDGTISLVENTASYGSEPRLAAPRYLEQIDPFVKSGVLSRPVAVDWNGDGKLDLLSGNSAGYLQWFENSGTPDHPIFTDRGYLTAAGKTIRRIAGPNGSIQGPAEEKWGYSNPSVADWDLDGDLDILVNDIWGSVHWYENTGTRTTPVLAAAKPIEVDWTSLPAPKPEWNWWTPKGRELVTQWRTTPKIVDWDRDGLPDLVMLNHQGYLSLYRRARRNGRLVLLPPERIFLLPNGRFLNLAAGRAGASGRRKIEFADLDSDNDLDLITDSDQGPVWYENTGTHARPVMQLRGAIIQAPLAGHNPTPCVTDWNGDGKLDLIIGAEDGFLYYFDGRYIEAQKL